MLMSREKNVEEEFVGDVGTCSTGVYTTGA